MCHSQDPPCASVPPKVKAMGDRSQPMASSPRAWRVRGVQGHMNTAGDKRAIWQRPVRKGQRVRPMHGLDLFKQIHREPCNISWSDHSPPETPSPNRCLPSQPEGLGPDSATYSISVTAPRYCRGHVS